MSLFEQIDVFSNRVALIDSKSRNLSYQQLSQLSQNYVRNLRSRSIVFFLCDNDIPSILFYVGMLNKDIVPLMLPHDSTKLKLTRIISEFKPNYIIGKTQHVCSEFSGNVIGEYENYVILELNSSMHQLNSQLSLLLATSGSTGNPSLVRLSRINLSENSKSIISGLAIAQTDRLITSLPMNYSYGLSMINTHLVCGATLILNTDSIADRSFWGLVQELKPSSLGGVPYSYEMLTRFKPEFLSKKSIHKFTQAGGKLAPVLVKKMVDYCDGVGAEFFVMYGQTEATARMAIATMADLRTNPSTIGRPIPGTRFQIRDKSNREIRKHGESGELVFYGQNVSLGSATEIHDLNLGDTNHGELRTGDLAHCDESGLYYLDGRLNRFAKVHGHRINLDDIQEFLATRGIESVVISHDESLVIVTQGVEAPVETSQLLSEFLGMHNSAFKYLRIDAFPRTNSGKLSYKDIEVLFAEVVSE